MKRTALYMRVSTLDQHPETQLYDLRSLAGQRGLQIVEQYNDTISGAKAKRPGLDAMMRDARRGRFDIVLVWASDRMARSVKPIVLLVCLAIIAALAILIYISSRSRLSDCELRRTLDQVLVSISAIEKITPRDRHVRNDAHKQINSVTKALRKPASKTPEIKGRSHHFLLSQNLYLQKQRANKTENLHDRDLAASRFGDVVESKNHLAQAQVKN